MIKLKTNLKQFETIINMIGKISYETDYNFNSEGIKIRAVDPSGTYLGIFNISKDMFDEYELEKDQTITLQNDLFSKLVKKVGKTEMNIEMLEDKIQLSNKKDKFTLKFFVGQVDKRPDPNPECASVWSMKSSEFSKIINDMSNLGVICCLDGSDILKIKMKSNMVEGETITSATKIQSEDCYCFYDLSFIEPVTNSKDLFDNIRVGFGADTPCIIKGTNKYLKFVYIVAPRVE